MVGLEIGVGAGGFFLKSDCIMVVVPKSKGQLAKAYFLMWGHELIRLIGPDLFAMDCLGLPEKMLTWLAGSAVDHMYLCVDDSAFYSTRAVG
jgi:hypothetical protein